MKGRVLNVSGQKEIGKSISNSWKESLKIKKRFLLFLRPGNSKKGQHIAIAIIIENNGKEEMGKKINPWKYAAMVDTRLAPIVLWESEIKKDYIPIIWEIKNGLDVTKLAA